MSDGCHNAAERYKIGKEAAEIETISFAIHYYRKIPDLHLLESTVRQIAKNTYLDELKKRP